MIINLLRLPGSYWLYIERIILSSSWGIPIWWKFQIPSVLNRKFWNSLYYSLEPLDFGLWDITLVGITKCNEAYRGQLHLWSVTWEALLILIAQVILLYSGEPLYHHIEMASLNTCAKSYSILFQWSSDSIFLKRVPNWRHESLDLFKILFNSENLTLLCRGGFEEMRVSQKCSYISVYFRILIMCLQMPK